MAFDFSENVDFVSSFDGRSFTTVQRAVILFNLQTDKSFYHRLG